VRGAQVWPNCNREVSEHLGAPIDLLTGPPRKLAKVTIHFDVALGKELLLFGKTLVTQLGIVVGEGEVGLPSAQLTVFMPQV
jgi:hypothetical protein